MSPSGAADKPVAPGASNASRNVPWRRRGQGASSAAAIAWGVLFVVVGTWLFLDQSLGIAMPRIPWGDLWPLAVIAFGLWIMLRAARRRRR